jgi:hypothetical protein
MTDPKLIQMPPQQTVPPSDGGDGGDLDRRLREVEFDVREIKTKMDQLATKEDIEKVRTAIEKKDAANSRWFVTVVAGAAVAVVAALIRTFVG